jgi:hypothetical protein
VNDLKDEWVFYFFSYNIDDRQLNILLTENNVEIFNYTFKISEQQKYLKKIKYSGLPIDICLNLYDGDVLYKQEKYQLNDETINDYFNNGHYREKL